MADRPWRLPNSPPSRSDTVAAVRHSVWVSFCRFRDRRERVRRYRAPRLPLEPRPSMPCKARRSRKKLAPGWLYPDSMRTRENVLAFGGGSDSDGRMIRGGFLIEEDLKALIALARDGLAAGRVTRRANALVLLDKGMSCQQVAEVLLFDDDTIRGWYELFEQSGVEGLSHFDVGGSSSKMTPLQCGALKAWVG